jgi:hypothetical protein
VVDPQRDIIDHRQRSKSLGQAAQINRRQSLHSLYLAPLSACYLSLDHLSTKDDAAKRLGSLITLIHLA